CGACTVLMSGPDGPVGVKSCAVLAVQADGAEVTTIEGLAGPDGSLHPVQRAFHEQHALQCGFCTPGMIMAAVDLLRENSDPSEAEVREGLSGNLCRCTGDQNIVRAVLGAGGALGEPNVVAAFSGADVADRQGSLPCAWPVTEDMVHPDRPPLAVTEVRHAGEAVAVVVARDRASAVDALAAIEVEYEPLPVVLDMEAALAEGAPLVHADKGTNRS